VRGAHGDGDACCHDAVRAKHADGEVGDVHRAALAAVETGGAAEQLAHHAFHRRALGERVAVAAVRRGEEIFFRQMDADTGGNCFLAGGQVERTADFRVGEVRTEGGNAALGRFLGGVLESADARHAFV